MGAGRLDHGFRQSMGGLQMKLRWLVTIFSVGFLFTAAQAADWPQWRGPQRTGVSEETGLLKQWPEEGPKLLWQVKDLGDGYGTAAVAGNRLYVVGSRGLENESVQALSVENGKVIWSARLGKVGNPNQEPPYPLARSTPSVDGGVVYALSSDGDLAAVQTATGEVLWRKSLRTDFGGVPGKWAYAESPLVDGDVLVVTPGGSEATIVALNKKDGSAIWKSAVPGGEAAGYSSAVATQAAGRKQYVQFLDKGIVGVDAKTGQFLWRYDKTATGPANIPTAVAHDGYVYSANARRFGGGLVRLQAAGNGVTAEEVYFERYIPNTMGGQVLVDGHLYGTNAEGLAAADFVSGQVKWQEGANGPGSVLYADGLLYVHRESGEVQLVEVTPERFQAKGTFTPPNAPEHPRGPREAAWAHPVVANGRLYIRDQGTVWCYDVKDAKAGK
jgi:outer membrane protein assembly factor BamB